MTTDFNRDTGMSLMNYRLDVVTKNLKRSYSLSYYLDVQLARNKMPLRLSRRILSHPSDPTHAKESMQIDLLCL